ncbi:MULTISPECIES: hypothetical protein [Bacteroides]|jgi:hypothetical protein|uniref:Uncharacterized protein n=1 Tax=Bacteroides faecium TaxID=2715212 RepID=A0A6H0KLR8_9BACE|nr:MULTISPECIES: hypothetical protein [Bacteroides]MCS2450753.1 hypothetical protein [Bacteroides thetaiotaomicron]QIU94322.1 hypothetical protein BacF7301_09260 [Bacteroides faecium]
MNVRPVAVRMQEWVFALSRQCTPTGDSGSRNLEGTEDVLYFAAYSET